MSLCSCWRCCEFLSKLSNLSENWGLNADESVEFIRVFWVRLSWIELWCRVETPLCAGGGKKRWPMGDKSVGKLPIKLCEVCAKLGCLQLWFLSCVNDGFGGDKSSPKLTGSLCRTPSNSRGDNAVGLNGPVNPVDGPERPGTGLVPAKWGWGDKAPTERHKIIMNVLFRLNKNVQDDLT